MNISEFDYVLPQNLIAQYPSNERCSSRLMILNRENGKIEHHDSFSCITKYFRAGDVLVINSTKVIPAKIIGKRPTGARVEMLIIEMKDSKAKAFIKTRKRPEIGEEYHFKNYKATVLERENNYWLIDFLHHDTSDILEELGSPPLPPYIKRKGDLFNKHNPEDKKRYQTVYANTPGAIAAPTAGLHFSLDLLDKIKEQGVTVVDLVLHVGLGTFLPINVENVYEHKMHEEKYHIPEKTIAIINQALAEKKRIFCVGTTSCRALESSITNNQIMRSADSTDIFIYPGYKFLGTSGLITNFHLPKSTLLLLISAFANKKMIMEAYEEAVKEQYRFFSYGDAMFLSA